MALMKMPTNAVGGGSGSKKGITYESTTSDGYYFQLLKDGTQVDNPWYYTSTFNYEDENIKFTSVATTVERIIEMKTMGVVITKGQGTNINTLLNSGETASITYPGVQNYNSSISV